jgi:hypothetical protein
MHSSGTHLSKEMWDSIKSIGDSHSKQEEDKITLKESEILKMKRKFNNSKKNERILALG